MQSLARADRLRLQPPDERDGFDGDPGHLIGKGHLIADSTVDALVKGRDQRRPAAHADARSRFPRLLAAGGSVQTTDDGALMVTGLEPSAIGDIAFYAQAPVHELSLLEASLEEAFMELTHDDVEYHAHGDVLPGTGAPNGSRSPQASWPTGPATR